MTIEEIKDLVTDSIENDENETLSEYAKNCWADIK